MVSVRAVRLIALWVCAGGIIGMIVSSALNHNGAAITFGIVTAVAILCSMVATSVAADTTRRLKGPAETAGQPGTGDADIPADAVAAIVERQIQELVDQGADETAVRQLVGEAVRLGRMLAGTS
jgi:hypothetical protein